MKDSDENGIPDKEDSCPDTPGVAEFNGCPDTDGDGIQDADDACPDRVGLAEFNGCPDTDGDGIQDSEDDCPDTPGLEKFNGCPDRDGDGVQDSEDDCPDEVGLPELNGCPEEEVNDESISESIIEIDQVVYFAFNGAKLYQTAKDTLDEVVESLNQHSEYRIEVQGHTDSIDTKEFNYNLSVRRAQAVKKYLISKGISAERLQIKGYGETSPVESNDTARGRALNRRVEFNLISD